MKTLNSFFTQVSSSIRILGWNRDASARATHLKAAGGNVPSATIERKSMSTKTSIKRIALVAAAALALGGFSAVSAQAASASTIAQVQGTGDGGVGGVAGPANSLQVLITTDGTVSPRKSYVTVTGGTITSAVSGGVIAANGTSAIVSIDSLTITTPTAGSIVINVYDATSASTYSSTVSATKTLTVAATGLSGIYSAAKSSVFIVAGETSTTATADDTILVPATAAVVNDTFTTAAATIQVKYKDGNGASITNDSITATITSGGGNINGIGDSATLVNDSSTAIKNVLNQYSKSVTSTNGGATFVVWPNGQVGPSVITVKNSAGTVLATKNITFYSTTPASIAVVVKKANVLNSNTPTAKVFAATVKDSGGNAISTASITMTVATGSTVGVAGTCAYVAADAVYYCTAASSTTNVAATTADNTETYTFTAGTATTTAAVKFVSGVAKTISVAGPASADPGAKVTYILTATGANGSALPDGDYSPGALLTDANPASNASAPSSIAFSAGETITLAAGVATDFTYAPFSGNLSLSWTVGGTLATARSSATPTGNPITSFLTVGLDQALAATSVTADDVAVSANTEATAAANAATDAANQAADAADNATQAAAEALAAVNTLATTVATLIDGIKSQIKALNTLILQIKAKLKA